MAESGFLKPLLVFVGSGAGGLLRYWWGEVVQNWWGSTFPLGTLVINVSGCLAMGFLATVWTGPMLIREEHRFAVLIGVLGGVHHVLIVRARDIGPHPRWGVVASERIRSRERRPKPSGSLGRRGPCQQTLRNGCPMSDGLKHGVFRTPEAAQRLTAYIGESDMWQDQPLDEAIVLELGSCTFPEQPCCAGRWASGPTARFTPRRYSACPKACPSWLRRWTLPQRWQL